MVMREGSVRLAVRRRAGRGALTIAPLVKAAVVVMAIPVHSKVLVVTTSIHQVVASTSILEFMVNTSVLLR